MALHTTNTYFHIRQQLTELGFDSLTAFLAARPGETYETLAKTLGGIAPLGIVNFQQQIARKEGSWEAFVRDVLERDVPIHLAKRPKVSDDFVVAAIVRTWAAHIGAIPEELADRARETFSRMLGESGSIDLSGEVAATLITEVAAIPQES